MLNGGVNSSSHRSKWSGRTQPGWSKIMWASTRSPSSAIHRRASGPRNGWINDPLFSLPRLPPTHCASVSRWYGLPRICPSESGAAS